MAGEGRQEPEPLAPPTRTPDLPDKYQAQRNRREHGAPPRRLRPDFPTGLTHRPYGPDGNGRALPRTLSELPASERPRKKDGTAFNRANALWRQVRDARG